MISNVNISKLINKLPVEVQYGLEAIKIGIKCFWWSIYKFYNRITSNSKFREFKKLSINKDMRNNA